MPKRRVLTTNQQVLILYHKQKGFMEEPAVFIEYRPIAIGDINHATPFFRNTSNEEVSGLDCFWIVPEEVDLNTVSLRKLQFDIIRLQIRALELSSALEYDMPVKINDPEIKAKTLIEKLGYDPRDESWIETDLAIDYREKNWFKFERENTVSFYSLVYNRDWGTIVRLFNEQNNDNITTAQAKSLSIKRMRYIMGSTAVRVSGNPDRETWKRLAKDFEETHRAVDERMYAWAMSRNGHFPLVKTLKELPFGPGPFFNECIEKIPHYFATAECKQIKIGSILRIVAYDPEQKYIRVDFPAEIRKQIRPTESTETPWISDGGDYIILVTRQDVDDAFEFLDGTLN